MKPQWKWSGNRQESEGAPDKWSTLTVEFLTTPLTFINSDDYLFQIKIHCREANHTNSALQTDIYFLFLVFSLTLFETDISKLNACMMYRLGQNR